jgi:hypothetical protein
MEELAAAKAKVASTVNNTVAQVGTSPARRLTAAARVSHKPCTALRARADLRARSHVATRTMSQNCLVT